MLVRSVNQFEDWRSAARELLHQETAPENVLWAERNSPQRTLDFGFDTDVDEPVRRPEKTKTTTQVPTRFLQIAQFVACHGNERRWRLLYRILWRLTHGEFGLLDRSDDKDVHELMSMEKAVRRRANRPVTEVSEAALMDRFAQDAPRSTGNSSVRATSLPQSAAPFLPKKGDIASLRKAAKNCRGCPLYSHGTQTVFGEGPPKAQLVFVGEQPGDAEDIAGKPFVGPAGELFNRILAKVNLPRDQVYVTNAVKHFKWTPRGKRRLHAKPSARETSACRPWLEAELQAIRPLMLVCLGATAAQSVLGADFRITKQRGQPTSTDWAPWTMATYHPSAVLRAYSTPGAEEVYDDFVADLELTAAKFRLLKKVH